MQSAGTLVLLIIIDRNILKKSTALRLHLTLTPITTLTPFNYRNKGYESKHYVAIVPADLRSAGIEY